MLEVLLNKIRIKHPENRLILSGIHFSVGAQQVISVVGENGSGKSTLLKVIPGLLDNRLYEIDGEVLFNGRNILTMDPKELQQIRQNSIKYVMQDSSGSFDPLKKFKYYFELIFRVNNAELKEAEDLLEFFQLPVSNKLFKLYPYETSGGMAQRISLILALLSHPEILLLDEPTSGIDSPISNLLLTKLKEFASAGKGSVVMVTHDLRFAEKASDKIAILNNGKLPDFYPADNFIKPANTLLHAAFGDGINEYLA